MRAAALAIMLGCHAPGPARTQPILVQASISGHPMWLEVAATETSRELGLSGRRTLGDDEGMVFVWPAAAPRAFWMRGTDLPLDIGFFQDDGTLASVATMAPRDLSPHESGAPVAVVIELPAGWFAAHRVEPGAHLTLPLPEDLPIEP